MAEPLTAEGRVLIHAPFGKDAEVLAKLADDLGLASVEIADADGLGEHFDDDCSALVATQEALGPEAGQVLLRHLEAQPSWSALPILALLADASRRPPALRRLEQADGRAELVVLQRPARAETVKSTLAALIASRRRQHQVRDQLARLAEQEAHLQFLLAELDHRVKNLLAKILSILALTRREAEDLADFSASFEARVRALVEAHRMLNGNGSSPATMRALVENALAPYLNEAGSNIRLEGPQLRLWPRGGLALAMALYELATNAAKYGALSRETGVVSVRWQIDGGTQEFTFVWAETGGPEAQPPVRASFGTQLLETIAPGELGGSATLEFPSRGVRWTLRAPFHPE